MKKAGAERASSQAIEEIKKFVVDFARKIAKDAVSYSRHAKRKTVKESDVELASKI